MSEHSQRSIVCDDHVLNERLRRAALESVNYPGFPREWPECRTHMEAIVAHLYEISQDDEAIHRALSLDFPEVFADDPAARDAALTGAIGAAKWRIARHPMVRQLPDWDCILELDTDDEPNEQEMQVVTSGSEVVQMCACFDIGLWVEGDNIRLSRPIRRDGPLAQAILRFKPGLLRQPTLKLVSVSKGATA